MLAEEQVGGARGASGPPGRGADDGRGDGAVVGSDDAHPVAEPVPGLLESLRVDDHLGVAGGGVPGFEDDAGLAAEGRQGVPAESELRGPEGGDDAAVAADRVDSGGRDRSLDAGHAVEVPDLLDHLRFQGGGGGLRRLTSISAAGAPGLAAVLAAVAAVGACPARRGVDGVVAGLHLDVGHGSLDNGVEGSLEHVGEDEGAGDEGYSEDDREGRHEESQFPGPQRLPGGAPHGQRSTGSARPLIPELSLRRGAAGSACWGRRAWESRWAMVARTSSRVGSWRSSTIRPSARKRARSA